MLMCQIICKTNLLHPLQGMIVELSDKDCCMLKLRTHFQPYQHLCIKRNIIEAVF